MEGVPASSDTVTALLKPKIEANSDLGIGEGSSVDASGFRVDSGHDLNESSMSIGERLKRRKCYPDGGSMYLDLEVSEEKPFRGRLRGRELASLVYDEQLARRFKRPKVRRMDDNVGLNPESKDTSDSVTGIEFTVKMEGSNLDHGNAKESSVGILSSEDCELVASKLEKGVDDNICLNPLTEEKEVSVVAGMELQSEETPVIEVTTTMEECILNQESSVGILSSEDCELVALKLEKGVDDYICLNPLTEEKEVSIMAEMESQSDALPLIEVTTMMEGSNLNQESPVDQVSSKQRSENGTDDIVSPIPVTEKNELGSEETLVDVHPCIEGTTKMEGCNLNQGSNAEESPIEKGTDDYVYLTPSTEQKEVIITAEMSSQSKETTNALPCIELNSSEDYQNVLSENGTYENGCLDPLTEEKEASKETPDNTHDCNIEESPFGILPSQDCDQVDDKESRSTSIGKDISRILNAITSKYGDITRNCLLQSPHMKVYVLLGICDLVQDLRNKQLKEIRVDSLQHYYQIVADAESMKVNVAWLRERLDDIKLAVASVQEKEALMSERSVRLQDIDKREKDLSHRRAELEKLKSEVEECEELLSKEVGIVDMLDKKINALTSEFPHKFLMDGLL